MPFVSYGRPLGSPAAVAALAAAAIEEARRRDVKLLELRSRREQPLALPVSHRKLTVLLDLPPGDPDSLWHALPAKLRSQIRRPQKEAIEVRFGVDQLEPFYGVFARHMPVSGVARRTGGRIASSGSGGGGTSPCGGTSGPALASPLLRRLTQALTPVGVGYGKRLPLALANGLGPLLVRGIP